VEFYGEPGSFVRVFGSGLTPVGVKGFRMFVYAFSWTGDLPTEDVPTRVALDNAYYGIASYSLTRNGNFEEDQNIGDFTNWEHPDQWFGWFDTMEPTNQLMPVGYENLLPFKPRARCYGYDAYSMGWLDGAFSFGQEVDISGYPDGSRFALTFYWHQNTRNREAGLHLRRPLGRVHVGIQCLDAASDELYREDLTVYWPYSGSPNNSSPYDNSDNIAYNHRIPVNPPNGTQRIGVHLQVEVNADPWISNALPVQAIDDVFLRVVSTPGPPRGRQPGSSCADLLSFSNGFLPLSHALLRLKTVHGHPPFRVRGKGPSQSGQRARQDIGNAKRLGTLVALYHARPGHEQRGRLASSPQPRRGQTGTMVTGVRSTQRTNLPAIGIG
jgi:hypothetical protein